MNRRSNKYLLAHRGYSGIAPENTKLAFDCALNFGFDGVELDVHLTKDKHLVIIHDESTKRTGNIDLKIENSDLEELQKVDLGHFWKAKIPFQKIMTLKEFFDLYLNKFKVINVEIKTDVIQYENIEFEINELIKQYDQKLCNKVIFSSFNFNSLETLHQLNPSLRLGFLWFTKKQFDIIDPKKFDYIEFFNPSVNVYFKDQAKYDSFNKPYNFWTIKSKSKYQKFIRLEKTHSLISNYLY